MPGWQKFMLREILICAKIERLFPSANRKNCPFTLLFNKESYIFLKCSKGFKLKSDFPKYFIHAVPQTVWRNTCQIKSKYQFWTDSKFWISAKVRKRWSFVKNSSSDMNLSFNHAKSSNNGVFARWFEGGGYRLNYEILLLLLQFRIHKRRGEGGGGVKYTFHENSLHDQFRN